MFEIGQKVRCVTLADSSISVLTEGEILTITGISQSAVNGRTLLTFAGKTYNGMPTKYYSERFSPFVEPPRKRIIRGGETPFEKNIVKVKICLK
jgi:hypothetical protein